MIRVAADLGQQNIPQPFVQGLIATQTLYWRVASESKTIEVWRDTNGKFFVVEGDFTDGFWGQENVKIVYEPKNLSDAKSYVRANYTISVDDYTEESVPQTAGITSKRLVKKSERS